MSHALSIHLFTVLVWVFRIQMVHFYCTSDMMQRHEPNSTLLKKSQFGDFISSADINILAICKQCFSGLIYWLNLELRKETVAATDVTESRHKKSECDLLLGQIKRLLEVFALKCIIFSAIIFFKLVSLSVQQVADVQVNRSRSMFLERSTLCHCRY